MVTTGGKRSLGRRRRGHARYQAADGVAVKVAHRQALQVRENSGAHVVHGLLPTRCIMRDLNVLGDEIEDQNEQYRTLSTNYAAPSAWPQVNCLSALGEITVDGDLKNSRRG